MKKLMLSLCALSPIALLATPPDPLADVTAALTGVDTIWTTVSALIIGVAIVTVGVRFMRKAK